MCQLVKKIHSLRVGHLRLAKSSSKLINIRGGADKSLAQPTSGVVGQNR